MPNITISLSSSTLQRAKAYVSQRDLSMSKLVEQRLIDLLDGPGTSATRREVFQRFSTGEISRRQSMKLLDVEDYGTLIAEMRKEGLPLPTRPDSVAEPSIAIAQSLLERTT